MNYLSNFFNNIITHVFPPLPVTEFTLIINILIYLSIVCFGSYLDIKSFSILKEKQKLKSFFGVSILALNLGIVFVALNILLTDIFFFMTNGYSTILFQEKGVVAAIGYTIYSSSLPYVVTNSVTMNEKVKNILNYVFISILLIFSGITFSVILSLAGIINFPLTIVIVIALFIIIVNILSILVLIIESTHTYSNINKTRFYFIILAIGMFTIDFIFNFIDFLFNYPQYVIIFNPIANLFNINPSELKLIFEYTVLPFTRIFTFALSLACFYLGLFLPIKLQVRLGLVSPVVLAIQYSQQKISNEKSNQYIEVQKL